MPVGETQATVAPSKLGVGGPGLSDLSLHLGDEGFGLSLPAQGPADDPGLLLPGHAEVWVGGGLGNGRGDPGEPLVLRLLDA